MSKRSLTCVTIYWVLPNTGAVHSLLTGVRLNYWVTTSVNATIRPQPYDCLPTANQSIMDFFIPFTTDPEQTERICKRIEQHLAGMGFGPLSERVYQVKFHRDNQLMIDTVGELCPITGETVLVIFRNDMGYLICSYSRGGAGGEPVIAKYSTIESVTPFDRQR